MEVVLLFLRVIQKTHDHQKQMLAPLLQQIPQQESPEAGDHYKILFVHPWHTVQPQALGKSQNQHLSFFIQNTHDQNQHHIFQYRA